MSDDPNKKGRDRKLVSRQQHEQEYQKRKAARNKSGNENRESEPGGEERGTRRSGEDTGSSKRNR